MAVAEHDPQLIPLAHEKERPAGDDKEFADFFGYFSKPRDQLAREAVQAIVDLHAHGYIDEDKVDYLLREIVSRQVEWQITGYLHSYFIPYAQNCIYFSLPGSFTFPGQHHHLRWHRLDNA